MRELAADMREGNTWNRLNEIAHRNEQLVAYAPPRSERVSE